jgi:hypothetical protein
VYHGTKRAFEAFDLSRAKPTEPGIFFTDDYEFAARFSMETKEGEDLAVDRAWIEYVTQEIQRQKIQPKDQARFYKELYAKEYKKLVKEYKLLGAQVIPAFLRAKRIPRIGLQKRFSSPDKRGRTVPYF